MIKIIRNMLNQDYHNLDGLSSTQFALMRKSMRAFELRDEFKVNKSVFDVGNLIHDAILLPHLVPENYIECETKGLDTIKAEKQKELNPDKIIIGQGFINEAKEIARKVNLIYGHLIEQADKEISFFYKDKATGLTFKCRPDVYLENSYILDVKSSKATTHAEFQKIIEAYDYDMQAAWYFDTVKLCGCPVPQIGWIVVPKEAPNCPFGFLASDELLEKGRSKYQDLISKWIVYKEKKIDELFKTAYSWEYRKNNFIGGNYE